MSQRHDYTTQLAWNGDTGAGYANYSRAHRVQLAPALQELELSADAAFLGDPALLNPEQLLLAAASSCQLLSFLAVAAREGVTVLGYEDDAEAHLDTSRSPARMDGIKLWVTIQVAPTTDLEWVNQLAHTAHEQCYIANTLAVPVELDVTVLTS